MCLRFAIIGCGRISVNHVQAAINNNLDIVALCDLDEKKVSKIINDFEDLNEVQSYVDYKKMLIEEKIDLIAICTESGSHAAIAIDCLEKGINLIIEKPIALSLSEADAIIDLAENKELKVCACHQNRFNKSIMKIREAVDQSRFGKMHYGTAHIRWNRNESYYKQAPWRGTWSQDGGALMNQCIHNIDLLRWMLGDDITEVVGMTDNFSHEYIEAEDFGIAMVRFANGSYGVIEGTTTVYPENLEETLYLFGEKGTVKAGGKSVNIIEEWRFEDGDDNADEVKKQYMESPKNVYGFGHTLLYDDVIDAINSDRAPYVDARAGRRALELVLAIYESSKRRKSIKLPLKDISTLNFKE